MKIRKEKEIGIFASITQKVTLLCLLSVTVGVSCAMFFYQPVFTFSEQNGRQQEDFAASKRVLDAVDIQFASRFAPIKEETLKTKLAQQGYTALFDKTQIESLYGYAALEKILANKASEIETVAADPQKYNWPAIKLTSFVLNADKCTAMVEFSGENIGRKQEIWRWTKSKNGWQNNSFAKGYTAKDVEISKEGISFYLSPLNNPKLSNLYVLKKTNKP
jgi:hypothetical protein